MMKKTLSTARSLRRLSPGSSSQTSKGAVMSMLQYQTVKRDELNFQEFMREVNQMSMTQSGVSTTIQLDQFQYEEFTTRIGRENVTRVQWDYRDKQGELYSGIATSVDNAQRAAAKFGYQIP
jgi:hypothetical protein